MFWYRGGTVQRKNSFSGKSQLFAFGKSFRSFKFFSSRGDFLAKFGYFRHLFSTLIRQPGKVTKIQTNMNMVTVTNFVTEHEHKLCRLPIL